MAKHGKRYEVAAAKIDRDRLYSPTEALTLVKQTATVSYDPTVDLAIRLAIDPRKADQMVRGSAALPNGIGKSVRVAVFAEGPQATEAIEVVADRVGPEGISPMREAGRLSVYV